MDHRNHEGKSVNVSNENYSQADHASQNYLPVSAENVSFLTLKQLGATLKKNFIIKRRMPCSLCCEMLLPVCFVLVLVLVWSVVPDVDIPQETFIKKGEEVEDLVTQFLKTSLCVKDNNPLGILTKRCGTLTSTCFPNKFNHICLSSEGGLDSFQKYQELQAVDKPTRFTSLDSMLLLHEYAHMLIKPGEDYYFGLKLPSGLIFAPTSSDTERLVTALTKNSHYFSNSYLGTFSSEDNAVDFSGSTEGEGKVLALVVVKEFSVDDATANFVIRVNRTSMPPTNKVRFKDEHQNPYEQYWSSGFTSLQDAIYVTLFKEMGIDMTNTPTISGAPMPIIKARNTVFLRSAAFLFPFLVVLSFMYTVSQSAKRMVEEKELRIREGTMIMGLSKVSLYLSWALTYAIQQFVTVTLMTLILDHTIYKLSTGIILWFVLMLFTISTIMLSFMMSTLFNKSTVAALVTPIVFCAISVPVFAVPADTDPVLLNLMSIFSPTAFSLAFRLITDYEMSRGFGFANFANSADDISLLTNVMFLILDTFLYALLGLYFDNVLPSEWGTKLHPLFCFMPSYWCKGKQNDEDSQGEVVEEENNLIESTGNREPSICIKNLYKEFDVNGTRKMAVNNLSLNWFPDQVNVLLGSNGAGKTTTINMLTGMLEITGGDCKVYGNSARNQMSAIRRDVGLCPQHNILFPTLTVIEHLDYFAAIKGIPSKDRGKSIEFFIRGVGLYEQRFMPAGNLSGGQKRKLSVAIAFIGMGRVILLDEPTAGMDVQARRSTWDLIQRLTPGRTIILTTHFMDEADILGRTVAIVQKGKVHCSGSSLFLKSRLGVGYALHIDLKDANENHKPLTNKLMEYVPDVSLISNVGISISYRLPMGTEGQFPNLFRWMESAGESLGINSFGINVTTLEEVFIRIAMDGTAHDKTEVNTINVNKFFNSNPLETMDWLHFNKTIGIESHEKTGLVEPHETRPENHEAVSIYSVWDDPEHDATNVSEIFSRQYVALLEKRLHNIRRDKRTQFYQLLLPVIFIIIALLLGKLGPPAKPELEIGPDMYKKDQYLVATNCEENLMSKIPGGYSTSAYDSSASGYWAINMTKQLLDTHDSRSFNDERFISWYCNDPKLKTTLLYFNVSGVHSSPEVLQAYYVALASSRAGKKVTLRTSSYPLPFTARESLQIETSQSFITAIFILIPFCFIPSVYTAWLVKERSTNAKHLQMVSGLNTYAYWLSNLTCDMVAFLITEILCIFVFLAFQNDGFVGSGKAFGATFLIFFLFGLSSTGFAYVASFFFTDAGMAQNLMMMFSFVCGFLLNITVMIMGFFETTVKASDVLRYIFRLIPSYSLGECLINLSIVKSQVELGMDTGPFAWDVTGIAMMYMAIMFPVLFGIAILLDSPMWLSKKQVLEHNTTIDGDHTDTSGEDEDVAKERQDVMQGVRPDDSVVVKNLRKVFSTPKGPKVAVRYLSFGIKKSEIFGFLGTNGAGKTTTLSMLSGEFPPTSGHGTLYGYDVVSETGNARRHLGYCPQYDALFDLMTPREHLYLYSALRGIPKNRMVESVNSLIRASCLEEYSDQVSKSLSGGNKRKLSLALALIGGPHVVFLDEPSAGMDPVARRSLWSTIENMSKGRCIVMTTHHLEEVEVLAHRVAIMDHGMIHCIGSLPHLRQKFGDGYELNLKARDEESVATVRSFMESIFPNAKLEEIHGERLTFMLPLKGTVLSHVFESIQGNSVEKGITDYSIAQSSLEQVFLRIAKANMTDDDE